MDRSLFSIGHLGALFLLLSATSGCALFRNKDDHRHEIRELIRVDLGSGAEFAASADGGDISEIDRRVRRWVREFSVDERESFRRTLERGSYYRASIEGILRRSKMPPELYYLALVESSFVIDATSSAKAAGIWQFMPDTARRYGLRIGAGIDERRHPIASTQAAAKHLRDLYRRFGSWYLAIAAYNAGPERIARAIREGGSRDFWVLARKRVLPRETLYYVPKFLAATLIGEHLDEFGFPAPRSRKAYPELQMVEAGAGSSLKSISRTSGLKEADLARLNPQWLKRELPLGSKRTKVWLPPENAVRHLAAALKPRLPGGLKEKRSQASAEVSDAGRSGGRS